MSTLEIIYQILSKHLDSLGHDYEELGLEGGPCVRCHILRRIVLTMNERQAE